MLAIRMQRTGRKGHAMFRVVVQDSRRTPTSGKVVAQLGSYDPHAKNVAIDKEKASFYLTNGAQPSERVARLLKAEGVKLPTWVSINDAKAGKLKNAEKLRKNRPAEEAQKTVVEEAPAAETPIAEVPETTAENTEPTVEVEASIAPEVATEPEVSEAAADEKSKTEA